MDAAGNGFFTAMLQENNYLSTMYTVTGNYKILNTTFNFICLV